MRIALIFVTTVLINEFADAQRKANITKPVVNLGNRPRPSVWNRPTEERRKLSIFPKNPMKFVVTPATIVKNEDSAKEMLPTKRPLMRKFTMQDRNEKGTWAFAPREPIMKTNRFTVTLAPPRSSDRKTIDEMTSEGSDNVKTVISRAKIEEPSSKNNNLNKGNFIQMMQRKKMEPAATIDLGNIEKKFVADEFLQITKLNDTQDFDHENDNPTPIFSNKSIDYKTGIRRLNDEDATVNADAVKNDSQNKYDSVKLNQTVIILNTETSKDLLRSRAVDLNELKYAIEQNESNALNIDNEESNNYNKAPIQSFNDLEILLEKIVNNSESSSVDFNEKDPPNSLKNETEATLEDIPTFDVTKPNLFYDVISPSNGENKNTNLNEDIFAGSILHGSQTMENDKKHSVSETNALNGEEDFTENLSDSLVVGWNLESLIDLMETKNAIQNHELLNERRDIVASNGKEIETKSKYRLTEKLITNKSQSDEVISDLTNDTEYEIQTEFPKEINSNDTGSMNSKEILLETYESNISLSSEELTPELIDEVSNVSVTENINLTIVEIPNEAFIESVSGDDILNELISNTLNNYTEELSNEPLINALNNITGEYISKETFLNISGEELSNEDSLIKEISNEYTIDTSKNFSGEEISNESSSNMAEEEISNESSADKSNNLDEEISNEYTQETSISFTGEEISNESSSNMAAEEISNESSADKSNNLTEEISNEYTQETSISFTGEEISNESSSNIAKEEISNESYLDKSNHLIGEISNEYTLETSNNFTEEEISNESFSNMAGGEISNESNPETSNNLSEEISNEDILETSNNFTGEEISNESSSNMAREEISNESYLDKSSNLTDEISNEYTRETSNHVTGEEISNESLSNMAGEEISNESDKSNNLTEEISSESTIKTSHHSKREKIFESALIDKSGIIIDEISDKSVESSQEPEILEEALLNRFKRSNNIIEEDHLPTTVSGFKYTGNEITLNHDLSYRNINA